MSPHRNPYDWRRAADDLPNMAVITAVQAMAAHPGIDVMLVITGREEQSRNLTEQWLRNHGIPFDELLMRTDGDYRPDDVIKEELYRQLKRPGSVGGSSYWISTRVWSVRCAS
ncbi:hypothetical protein A5746_16110 [Mycolicibacterium conceptionense]|nr:hypothetical protein A5639_22765 [Mycolicibacterium conceptionense]OMB89631.1 hypothetical protein A5741_12815 [Mycolicibacterium conceptionense]OMB96492.1 hypothetical protein A5746_16110 [Mycolicibacterium conceptionense]